MLTTQEGFRIRGEAMIDDRTWRRFLEGHPIKNTTRARIEEACKKLGISANRLPKTKKS